MLRDVGFVGAEIRVKEESREYIKYWLPESGAEDYVVAADIIAYKPATAAIACERAMKRAVEFLYGIWLAQAKHHAQHTDLSPQEEAPACLAPGPEKKPLPKC